MNIPGRKKSIFYVQLCIFANLNSFLKLKLSEEIYCWYFSLIYTIKTKYNAFIYHLGKKGLECLYNECLFQDVKILIKFIKCICVFLPILTLQKFLILKY